MATCEHVCSMKKDPAEGDDGGEEQGREGVGPEEEPAEEVVVQHPDVVPHARVEVSKKKEN